MSKGPRANNNSLLAVRRRRSALRALQDQRVRRAVLHAAFTKYFAPGTLAWVPFDDHEIFVDPRDDKIGFTILSGRPWQRAPFERALALAQSKQRIHPNGLFIDVGANIGAVTIYALLSGRFAHVLAIEPDPYNRSLLERNIELNGYSDRVTVVAAAASDAARTMMMYRDAKNFGAHSVKTGFSKSQADQQSVRADTLDNLVREAGWTPARISLVKIDVEGHEQAVVDGMANIAERAPPVLMEVTCRPIADGRFEFPARLRKSLLSAYQCCALLNQDRPALQSIDGFAPDQPQHDMLIL